MPSALVLLADGTEEMEFTITYDTLVRAGITTQSVYVLTPSFGSTNISPPVAKGSRGINIMPDSYLDATACGPGNHDLLVIPGGATGAATIATNATVQQLVRSYLKNGKYVGMICAGSLAAHTSKLPFQPLTSHPSVKAELEPNFDYSEDSVVVSGNLVTSRGPGTAFPFALTLVELLCGKEKREEVRAPMVFPSGTPW
ncbi:class I glutamine amidotransferase-like protein [Ephemerocybe angulata]|uniref:D-lactate dehydratase n=1 Tax=Ephemerocybe angulata TaxID=980116 RepID=A0A8H6M3T5_9AGAR|nr:class I glutamine amidotransferase-like protein [Tulosesus angulatus]